MKKILTILSMTTLAFSANAQKEGDFKPFKVDLSAGYAIPGGSGSKGGLLFVVEPKYAVMSNLSVGLRLETAVVARGTEDASGSGFTDLEVKASASYLLTGDYYFSSNYSFRPFAGIGLGIYSLASASATATTTTTSEVVKSKFGEMIRVGFETGHFRLGLEYNIVPSTEVTVTNGSGSTSKSTTKNGYIGIKLGVVLGGGPR